jgi:hypothetical protein
MRLISIQVSPHQLRKLKKGHKIRLRKGTGFNLIVHPETYHLMSRAFNKNKGYQVKLSPQEQELNKKNASQIPEPETEDEGPELSETDEEIEGTGLRKSIKGKGKMRGCAVNQHKGLHQTFKGPKTTGLTRQISKEVANANGANASMTNKAIEHRIKDHYPTYQELSQQPFAPFSRGYGVNTSNSILGRGGTMPHGVGFGLPPALQSQPYSANYQMSHFLPPHFQHYNNSMSMSGEGIRRRKGQGLYVGHGLFS